MTTLAKQYKFTARITAKGMQGNSAKVEFDWKLPGSKFFFVLYERDPDKVDGWNVGDFPTVTIEQGSLKDGKDGRYTTDYFYNLVDMEEAARPSRDPQEEPSAEDFPTAQTLSHPSGKGALLTPEEPQPVPQALGACQNHAMMFIESGIIPVPEDRDPINWLWELRDLIYRGVNKKPYQDVHFCYQHETQRIQSPKTGVWGHRLPDGTGCVDADAAQAAPAGAGAEPGGADQ